MTAGLIDAILAEIHSIRSAHEAAIYPVTCRRATCPTCAPLDRIESVIKWWVDV